MVGLIRQGIIFIMVELPEPFGPREPVTVPLRLIHGDSGRVCLALSSAFATEHIGK